MENGDSWNKIRGLNPRIRVLGLKPEAMKIASSTN